MTENFTTSIESVPQSLQIQPSAPDPLADFISQDDESTNVDGSDNTYIDLGSVGGDDDFMSDFILY